jgi:long-chain acyl-CoA synthetase
MLMTDPKLESYNLSSLEFIAMMGMSVPKVLMEEFSRRLKGLITLQGYGLTETSPLITLMTLKDANRKRDSIGIPVRGAEIKIVDEDGSEVPTGEAGEIIVRGPMVMKGYFDQPKETNKVIKDGWFYTGDLGCFDDEGFIYHLGRSKDIVITGGLNVYPAEVENVLLKHNDVMEAAVIGAPDEKRGEILQAYVVKREGSSVTDKELMKFCREHLADFKVPRELTFIKQIPLLGVGKVDKVALRENRYEAV